MILTVSFANTSTTDRYYPIFGWNVAARSSTSGIDNLSAFAPNVTGTITDIVATGSAAASDGTGTFELYKNGSATGTILTMANGATQMSATGLSIAVIPGDQFGFYYATSGTPNIGSIDFSTSITLT